MKTMTLSLLVLFSMGGLAQSNKPHIIKKVYTDKSIYTNGETVVITIRAINTSSNQDTLIFPDLCEAYPYVDYDDYLMTFSLGCFTAISPRIIPGKDSIQWEYKYPHSSNPEKKLSVGQHHVFGYFRNICPNSDTVGFSVKDGTNSVPTELQEVSFWLEQNYPNPFNPSTTISFSLARRSFVSLVIYNVLGQEIATLVNTEMSNGSHAINWVPQNAVGGFYYCRIVADNYCATKKLVLAK